MIDDTTIDKSDKKSHDDDNSEEDNDDDQLVKLVNQSDFRSTNFPHANSFAKLGMKVKKSEGSEGGSAEETPSIADGEVNHTGNSIPRESVMI